MAQVEAAASIICDMNFINDKKTTNFAILVSFYSICACVVGFYSSMLYSFSLSVFYIKSSLFYVYC